MFRVRRRAPNRAGINTAIPRSAGLNAAIPRSAGLNAAIPPLLYLLGLVLSHCGGDHGPTTPAGAAPSDTPRATPSPKGPPAKVKQWILSPRSAARRIPLFTQTPEGRGVSAADLSQLRWTEIDGASEKAVFVMAVTSPLERDDLFTCGGHLFARRPEGVLRLRNLPPGTVLMTGEPDIDPMPRHVAVISRVPGAPGAQLRCGVQVALPTDGVVSLHVGRGTETSRQNPKQFAWLVVAHQRQQPWSRAQQGKVSPLPSLDSRELVRHFPVLRLRVDTGDSVQRRERFGQSFFQGVASGLFVYAKQRLTPFLVRAPVSDQAPRSVQVATSAFGPPGGYVPHVGSYVPHDGFVHHTDVIEPGEPLLILKPAHRKGRRVVLAADGMRFEVADEDLGLTRPPQARHPAWPKRVRGCWDYRILRANYATAALAPEIAKVERMLAEAQACQRRLQVPLHRLDPRTDRFMALPRPVPPPQYACPALSLPSRGCVTPALRRAMKRLMEQLSAHRRSVLNRILQRILTNAFYG